ncbi:MAG: N-acetylneuraminate synthase family protein [Magnetococcales bacterium]|nr:N-acetylneuraminate synthase family protein [Magnetococcales bacterium]
MSMTMKNLSDHGFKTDHAVYVIAEAGLNHGGDLDVAKQLIDSAVRSGADAVKFQTYITANRAPAGNQALFDIFTQHELPFEAFGELKTHAEEQGIDFFSTPFCTESVDYLQSIDLPLYKLASFDVTNVPLLKRAATTGKPVILSVGMANLKEVEQAYEILTGNGGNPALLHCISAYPTPETEANLAAVWTLKERFDCVIGQSDHTPDIQVPLFAVAAGAQIIEKHYRVDEEMECIDAPVSITEQQMVAMIEQIRRLEEMFGSGEVALSDVQKDATLFRRVVS